MDGQQSTGPDNRRDEADDEEEAPGYTLNDPNRVHVTLDNLVDLARLDAIVWPSAPPDQEEDSAEPPTASAPPRALRPDAVLPPPRPGEPQSLPRRQPPPPAPPAPVAAPDEFWSAGGPALRARWARPAQRWLPEALALVFASGALVIPSVWLLVTAVVCVVAGSVAFVASGHSLTVLPWRALRRGVSLLHPRSSTWAPVLIARVVLVSVLVPGVIAAGLWLADEGRVGVFAAARSAAWTHGFRVAGVLACVMLLTSVGDGRLQRADRLRRLARPLSDGALVVLVVGSLLVFTLAVVTLPRPEDPVASAADGLGWLPAPARGPADRVRDDIVTAELDSLSSCLSKRGRTNWRTSYTSDNGVDEPDVARLQVVGSDPAQPPHDLVAALIAAHNQLAPWVEAIEVRLLTDEVVRVDRTGLARHRPLTDPAELAAAATGLERAAVGPVDVALALRCSAGAVI